MLVNLLSNTAGQLCRTKADFRLIKCSYTTLHNVFIIINWLKDQYGLASMSIQQTMMQFVTMTSTDVAKTSMWPQWCSHHTWCSHTSSASLQLMISLTLSPTCCYCTCQVPCNAFRCGGYSSLTVQLNYITVIVLQLDLSDSTSLLLFYN